MSRDLIRLMQSLFPSPGACSDALWQPAVDVYQTRTGWLLKFELAGVRPQDLKLEVQGNRLVLQGVRRDWFVEEGFRHYRMEITYSAFKRSMELPCDLDLAHISTEYRYGLLLVRIEPEAEK
jgi:HSP20 family protein